MSDRKITLEFNDKVVRQFMLASLIWGAVGMLVGVLIAAQLNFWQLNFGTSWLTWSRLRPLHTNAVIFALVESAAAPSLALALEQVAVYARVLRTDLVNTFDQDFIAAPPGATRRRSA